MLLVDAIQSFKGCNIAKFCRNESKLNIFVGPFIPQQQQFERFGTYYQATTQLITNSRVGFVFGKSAVLITTKPKRIKYLAFF